MKTSFPLKSIFLALFFSTLFLASAQVTEPLKVLSKSANSIHLSFEAPILEFKNVTTPEGIMSVPHLQGGAALLERGAPDLQKFACSYIIPEGELPSVKVLKAEFTDYNLEVAPSKGNLFRDTSPADVPFVFGSEYQKNEFYPTTLFEAQTPHIVRDFKAQALWIYPFQYNPVLKILRVYSAMELEVSFASSIAFPLKVDSQYDLIYRNLFLNYDLAQRATIDTEEGAMLIIADSEFIDQMDDFRAWKTQKGIANEIVDIASIGNSQDDLKAYIQNYYDTHNLTYVLFVGDHQQIPAYQASSGYSDNYYGYLDGDDSYPEVLVGRFSAETKAHVLTQVNRLLQYEQSPPISDAYGESVVVGSAEGPGDNGEYDYEHLRNIQALHLDYTYTQGYELFDGSQGGADSEGNPTASDLQALLQADLGIINYTGHGSDFSCASSGYSSTEVNNLTNTEVHPFFWSVACVNGNFTGTTCFAEAWLRASDNGLPTGAIATLMSTINQSWSPPMKGQDAMNSILTQTSETSSSRSFAGISMNGCMEMNDTYGAGGADMTDTWTCFGDPSVILRTKSPEPMLVSYDSVIPVGASSMDVSCSSEGALVSITLAGEIIGMGTVSNGFVSVSFEPISILSDLTITVTAFNTVPHIGSSSVVVLEGPWLVVTSHEIGNQDGLASYNESFPLYFTVENIGTQAAASVNLTAQASGSLEVMNEGVTIPALEPGASYSYTAQDFMLNVIANAVDGEDALLVFSMQNESNNWSSQVNIPIHAPVLEITEFSVELAFGDTTALSIVLTNTGAVDLIGGLTNLYSNDTYLTVVNDVLVTDLPAGASVVLDYLLMLDVDAPVNTSLDLALVVTQESFEQSNQLVVQTPMCQTTDLTMEILLMTDQYASETSWSLTNSDGLVLGAQAVGSYQNYSTDALTFCAAEGTQLTFAIQDTYGDGIIQPNGYWISVCGNELAQGSSFGSDTSHTFVLTCDFVPVIEGCTDEQAVNFNPDATADDDSCEYETEFSPWEVLITGTNHTLAVGSDALLTLNGLPLESGDWIGVFYTDDAGTLQCAGYAEWNGVNTALAAQGDDSTTEEIDGLQNTEPFVWMIWDASENVIYNANATYLSSMPNQGEFEANGISSISSLTNVIPVSEQVINLPAGWSLFSSYITAEDMSFESLLASIIDDVVVVKDNLGNAYLVDWAFNGIGEMQVGEGYLVKTYNETELTLNGTYSVPEDNPITLNQGWNLFGSLRLEPSDIEAVFEPFVTEVIIVKNSAGEAYLPDWDFNGIGLIEPGKAYQVKMQSTQMLTYLANHMEYRCSHFYEPMNRSLKYFSSVAPSESNMHVLLPDEAWEVKPHEGAEISVYSKDGILIGSAVYTSPNTLVTLWGDDTTTEVKEGLAINDEFSFQIWSNNQLNSFEVHKWAQGSSLYAINALNIASLVKLNSVSVAASQPRELVKVVNVLGQEVLLDNKSSRGEVLFTIYRNGEVEKAFKY